MKKLILYLFMILLSAPTYAAGIFESATQKTIQCWGCPVFDLLFQIVSKTAAALYDKMAYLGLIIMAFGLAFYVLYIIIKNMKTVKDVGEYQKKLLPTLINAAVISALLGMGVAFPKLVTRATFEPITNVTIMYADAVLQTTPEFVDARVKYEPMPIDKNSEHFYNPELRDGIIRLMKTSTTVFQSFIMFGFAAISSAFTWSDVINLPGLLEHTLIFLLGLIIIWFFFKLFIKFCWHFVDVIVALTMFAFFFPLMLVGYVFQNSESSGVVKGLGSTTASFFSDVINAITTLFAVMITYIVSMTIMAYFLSGSSNPAGNPMMQYILSGDYSSAELALRSPLATNALLGIITLAFVIEFIMREIPRVQSMITDAFSVKPSTTHGDNVNTNLEKLAGDITNTTKKFIKSFKKKEDKKQ